MVMGGKRKWNPMVSGELHAGQQDDVHAVRISKGG